MYVYRLRLKSYPARQTSKLAAVDSAGIYTSACGRTPTMSYIYTISDGVDDRTSTTTNPSTNMPPPPFFPPSLPLVHPSSPISTHLRYQACELSKKWYERPKKEKRATNKMRPWNRQRAKPIHFSFVFSSKLLDVHTTGPREPLCVCANV